MRYLLLITYIFPWQVLCAQSDTLTYRLESRIGTIESKPHFQFIRSWSGTQTFLLQKNFIGKYSLRKLALKYGTTPIELLILLGENNNHQNTVAIDKNHNNDFSDDVVRIGPGTDSVLENVMNDSINVEAGGSDWIHIKYVIDQPRFIQGADADRDFFFMVGSNDYFYHKLSTPDYSGYLGIYSKYPLDFTDSSLRLLAADTIFQNFVFPEGTKHQEYQIGDTFKLGNQFYEFAGCNVPLKLLHIKPIFSKDLKNSMVGFMSYYVHTSDLSGKDITIGGPTHAFMLIEFGGTWCEPCKKVLPDLKEIRSIYPKRRLQMVGIAYEKTLGDATQFKSENKVPWPIIFQPMSSNEGIVKQFKVNEFPTYIVINTEGRIMFRDSGVDGFGRLKLFLRANLGR